MVSFQYLFHLLEGLSLALIKPLDQGRVSGPYVLVAVHCTKTDWMRTARRKRNKKVSKMRSGVDGADTHRPRGPF